MKHRLPAIIPIDLSFVGGAIAAVIINARSTFEQESIPTTQLDRVVKPLSELELVDAPRSSLVQVGGPLSSLH